MQVNLDNKLKNKDYDKIWQEYCSFLDLSLDQYMEIQKRLLMEQISLYANSDLGKSIMKNHKPRSVEEFRKTVPLTTYDDYASFLMTKNVEALPAKPIIWIETTWEGGKHPVKVAPYTDGMIKSNTGNFLACLLLSTSNKRGSFSVKPNDKFLYGMAPLPYFTGIVPHMLQGEITLEFLPPNDIATKMSFGERNRAGFKLGMERGIDFFFGLSSVIVRMSESFAEGTGGGNKIRLRKTRFSMLCRLIRAGYRKKVKKETIYPKDIWKTKGIICAGTDTNQYKAKIEKYWGVRPLEVFGGTELACVATETWGRNGLIFFPDACFYEFIPQAHLHKTSGKLNTYLMNELIPGENYELVITSLKGGAFARYRVGDVFKCLSLSNEKDGVMIPHFQYVDRVSSVIDLAGFTRITETTINEAITISKLDIYDWFAVKKYDEESRPYIELFVEIDNSVKGGSILTINIIKDQLEIYFNHIDHDYKDLKKMLGIDPLRVIILPQNTISSYLEKCDHSFQRINPNPYDITEILKIAGIK